MHGNTETCSIPFACKVIKRWLTRREQNADIIAQRLAPKREIGNQARLQIASLLGACGLVFASGLTAESAQLEQGAIATGIITNSVSPLPVGEQVIRQVLERSAAVAAMTNSPAWA